MADYFNTGSFRKNGTWHKKERGIDGGIFDGNVRIFDQAQKVGMVYRVHKLPVKIDLPDGTEMPVGNQFLLMRPPTEWDSNWKKLRATSGRYTPIQNTDLINILEPLNEDWPIEGMGVLKNGQIVFFELKLDPYDVGGNANETILPYFLLGNDHTMGSAFTGLTNVRVVCWNTWRASISGETVLTIPHHSDVQLELDFRAELMRHAIEARKEQQYLLNQMFTKKVQPGTLNKVVEKVFPYPKPGRAIRLVDEIPDQAQGETFDKVREKAEKETNIFEMNKDLADRRRSAVADEFFKFNDQHPYAGDTVYSLFNAITAVTNHSSLFTGSPDKNYASLMFGQKNTMNQVGWQECVELVK